MSTHSYASEYPALNIDPAIESFYEGFYEASDKPDCIESYADFFTKDASFTMASKSVQGTSDIIQFRKGMWTSVKSRKHTVDKVFPFGNDSSEVTLLGKVDFTLKNDKNMTVPWAGHAKLVKDGGAVKMSHYQVYMDTMPTIEALK